MKPITCDDVRALVEGAGKIWAVVVSGTAEDTQFTTWGRTPEQKIYASELSAYIAEDLCGDAPTTVYESFHEKGEAARNKAEVERLRNVLREIEQVGHNPADLASDLIGKPDRWEELSMRLAFMAHAALKAGG